MSDANTFSTDLHRAPTHEDVANHVATHLDAELEFTAEPQTLDEFAAEFLRLQQLMAPLKKRMADMKAAVLERTGEGLTELDNGINVKRTTYCSAKFMMDEFKDDHTLMYERYLEDITKERVEIKYRKH